MLGQKIDEVNLTSNLSRQCLDKNIAEVVFFKASKILPRYFVEDKKLCR